jgi:class 3 adenylate cyclase/predicted ATPase
MFCDLVGSTAISQQLDPEELREIFRNYHRICTGAIGRFDGFIAKYLGDGVLIYFGYPTAHEDDPQRAIRAGLEIVAVLENSKPIAGIRPQARIGIHTGLVLVTEIGSGEQRERTAVLGETPNLAARLQEAAEPGTVVISAATHKLVRGFFECEDRVPHQLKGISAPVRTFRVVAESGARNRFEVALRSGLTALIGRQDESGLLLRQWEHAKAGQGRVVLLSGEPGIGKSRLVQELQQRIGSDAATRLEFQFSPYYQNSALHPIIQHLERLLGFEHDNSPEQKREKLKSAIHSYRFNQTDTLALVAALLSLPSEAGSPPVTPNPQRQKQRTQEALVGWLLEETERKPVLVVCEDLHWADPSSLELIGLVIDQLATIPILMVMTFRPEFTAPWPTRSYVVPLVLSRLPQSQSELMLGHMAQGKALPLEIVREIIGKTDGVPLFIEELTKTVLESGLLREINGRYELIGPLPQLAIPETLHDSLMARLDRLVPLKQVAQLGATIGREFSYGVIRAISPMNEKSLQSALKRLVEAEVVFQNGLGEQARYIFKHALIQDAAYQSLLRSTRQQYHQRIAQILETQFIETKQNQPELLAYHYTEAGLYGQASPYWGQAGQNAFARSANAEAISHYKKAIETLQHIPDSPERALNELLLQVALGPPLMAMKGWGAPELASLNARAQELSTQIGEVPQLFAVWWGLGSFCLARADYDGALAFVGRCLRFAENTRDSALLVESHWMMGHILLFQGEFVRARDHLERSLSLYDSREHRGHSAIYGQDPGPTCLNRLGHDLWYLGYPDQSLSRVQASLSLAQESTHSFTRASAMGSVAWLHLMRREVPATQQWAEATITLCAEQEIPFFLAAATIWRGWAEATQGHVEDGIAGIRQGMENFSYAGIGWGRPFFLALMAEAYGHGQQWEKGLNAVEEGLTIAAETGERWYEAELYRLKGELTLHRLQTADYKIQVPSDFESSAASNIEIEAQACFQKAIEIALEQSAKSLELRAAMSLGRLWRDEGRHKAAHDLLHEIYNWFTEGFDTADLKDAKVLLDELSE